MNKPISAHLDRWHQIVYQKDLRGLSEFLAEDIVFRSPYLWRPYHGRGPAVAILSTVIDLFQDFTYHRELIDGRCWALEFSARIEKLSLKGIDLMQFDDQGRVIEFEVFIRPANALQRVGKEMGRRMGA